MLGSMVHVISRPMSADATILPARSLVSEPFHALCQHGAWSDILLQLNATVELSSKDQMQLCDKEGDSEMTPLNLAIHNGAPAAVIELLAKAATGSLAIPDKSGRLPLHNLAIQYHKLVCATGVRTNTKGHGMKVEEVIENLFRTLIHSCPSSTRVQDMHGKTPIHCLLCSGDSCIPSVRVVDLLMSGSPNAKGDSAKEDRSSTAPSKKLIHAEKENNGNNVLSPRRTKKGSKSLALKKGSTAVSTVASISDSERNYPLHLACSSTLRFGLIDNVLSSFPSAIFRQNKAGKMPVQVLAETIVSSQSSLEEAGKCHMRKMLRAMVSKWDQSSAKRCTCEKGAVKKEISEHLVNIAKDFCIDDSTILDGLKNFATSCSCKKRQVLSPIMERRQKCKERSRRVAGQAKSRNSTQDKNPEQTLTEDLDIETFAWYEQGTFPLKENSPLKEKEESPKALRENIFGLKYALKEQNSLMNAMAKTNSDLQGMLAQQVTFATEKDEMIRDLLTKLGDEADRNQASAEELRYLKVQIADMELGLVSETEERAVTGLLADFGSVSVTSVTEEHLVCLKEQNYDFRREIVRQNELMGQMGMTNTELNVVLKKALQYNSTTSDELRLLRVRMADMETTAIAEVDEGGPVWSERKQGSIETSDTNGYVSSSASNSSEVEKLTGILEDQRQQIGDLQQELATQKEGSGEGKTEDLKKVKRKFRAEEMKCKKVIKAQERIINDLKEGLNQYKDSLAKHMTATSQEVLLEKMATMNDALDTTLEQQLALLKEKNVMLLDLESSLEEERSVSRSVLISCDSTVSSTGLDLDRKAKLQTMEAELKGKNERISTLYSMMKRERLCNEEMLYMKKYENMKLRQELHDSAQHSSRIVGQLKAESKVRERRSMGTMLAFILSLFVHVAFVLGRIGGECIKY